LGNAKKVKRRFAIVILLTLSSSLVFAKKKKIRYPVVISVSDAQLIDDKVEVVAKQGKIQEVQKKLRVGQSLRDKALIQVGEKGQIRIDLAPKASLIIFGNSTVEIPVIAWEDGAIDQIILQKGRLRYDCETFCKREIKADLYDETPEAGDYIYTYEPQIPKFEALVIDGELKFRGFENENSVTLKANQKASFTGVLEGSEIAYDVLLGGRKVAKGKLSKVETLSEPEQKKFTKLFSEKKVVRKKVVSTRLPSQICEKPNAELNQCQWTCEENPKKAKNCAVDQGAVCVRYRCNANGEWAEAYTLPDGQNRCGLKPIVAACDY